MKMNKLFLIIGVLALLFLAACSSSELPNVANEDNMINTNNDNSDSGNDISINIKEQKQAQAQAQEQTDSGDVKKVFEDLVSKGESSEFKVNYRTTTNVQGQTEVIESAWFLKDKNFRMDNKGNVEGQAYESRMITTETQAIMCNKQGSWTCFDLGISPEEAQAQEEGQAEIMTTEDFEEDLGITAAPDRKIAGTTAKCFIVAIESASSEFCYSKEGIPLYFETNAEGVKMIQEATSYSTSVSNSDFVLPAKPQDMQSMVQQYATG